MRRARGWQVVLGLAGLTAPALLLGALPLPAAGPDEALEREYLRATPQDPIARLQKRLDSGTARLDFDPRHGYLPALLRQLRIPVSSQTLVFSKTSFQRERISRQAPRALYFNDEVYVGWVQDSELLEVSSVDPQWGAIFYTLRQSPTSRPKFVRQTYDCLQCHHSSMTQNVPGHILRSVYARADGQPDLASGTYLTTDESPWEERWGGWYVTGTHGSMRHMGNVITTVGEGFALLDRDAGANVTQLNRRFDTSAYLVPSSDIVALLVLQHQTHVHNLLARAHWLTQTALRDEKVMDEALGRPAGAHTDSTWRRIRSACEPLVEALLFARAEPLSAPVAGTTGFAAAFAAQGPRDSRGRSLRQLDLKTRLFRHPCSFLVYSEAFDSLPDEAKQYVYRRLVEILDGREKGAEYARLAPADRQAIREILRETKPDFVAAEKAQAGEAS